MFRFNGIGKQVTAASVAGFVLVGTAQGAMMDDFQDDTVGNNPNDATSVSEDEANGSVARVVDGSSTPADPFGGSGNKSLLLQDDDDAGEVQIQYEFNTDPITTDGATASVDFYLDGNAFDPGEKESGPGFESFVQNNDFNDAGRILVSDSNSNGNAIVNIYDAKSNGSNRAKDAGGGNQTFAVNQKHTLQYTFNFTDQTYTASIDGETITADDGNGGLQSVFDFADDDTLTELKQVSLNSNGSGNTDSQVFLDNLNVSEVPEPASLALMGIGGVLMLSTRRRQPKA